MTDRFQMEEQLLANIQARWTELAELLEEVNAHRVCEDFVYRFYHQSFKVYAVQTETQRVVEALRGLAPAGTTFSPMFEEIYRAGAGGKEFEQEHNEQWTMHTRPLIEAFFHVRYFLEMVVKYGKELQMPGARLPSGWAAVLCLYNLR